MARIVMVLTILFFAISSADAKPKQTPSIADTRTASILVEAGSGTVLHQVNADELRYPASLTKIMTLYLVFDALDRGTLRLDQRIKTSAAAARQQPSKLGLAVGESIRVEDAILGLVTKSANDAAVVLAEAVAGSEVEFGQRMTAKARQLGMSRTTFRNASGLPDRQQQTTARDMATLGLAMLRDHKRQYGYFSRSEFVYDGTVHANHNRLLNAYEGMDGIKTGFINASGFNLVASATRDGKRLVGVVFGGTTAASRDREMVRLMDAGFNGRPMAPPSTLMVKNDDDAGSVGKGVKRALQALNPVSTAHAATIERGSGYGVQVGAFGRSQAAEAEAKRVAKLLPSLAGNRIVVDQAEGKSKFYRARIADLSQQGARDACKMLKTKGIDCLVVTL